MSVFQSTIEISQRFSRDFHLGIFCGGDIWKNEIAKIPVSQFWWSNRQKNALDELYTLDKKYFAFDVILTHFGAETHMWLWGVWKQLWWALTFFEKTHMCGEGVKLSEITYILKVRRVQIDMEPQLRVFLQNVSKLATFLASSSEILKLLQSV